MVFLVFVFTRLWYLWFSAFGLYSWILFMVLNIFLRYILGFYLRYLAFGLYSWFLFRVFKVLILFLVSI